MGYDLIVRNGVKLIDKLTRSLQPNVCYFAWLSQDAYGKPSYAVGVFMPALVDQTIKEKRDPGGRITNVKARVTFLRPMPITVRQAFMYPGFSPTGFAMGLYRNRPVDTRDRIVFADGTDGLIVDVEGLIDRGTGHPYFSEAWVGY